jgi:signal transduction histidine kinase
MSETVWFRSLYWRIAFAFVALVAALLVTQALVLLWLTGRAAELWPGRSPAEFAQAIAADAADALAAEPGVDLDAYLNERHASRYRAFAVALADGRVILSRRVTPPATIGRAAMTRLTGRGEGLGRRGGRGAGTGAQGTGVEPFGRRGAGRGRGGGLGPNPPGAFAYAPIVVDGSTAGIVAVPLEQPPLWVALRDVGPVLGAVALGLLAVGTAIAALVVFRPAHRRLRALQQAARELGGGNTDVRATEAGGDEVASLAKAFNEMAQDLGERSRALVEADRSRRQLLADVSHELMTPLAAIRGYVETLAMPDVPIDDETRRRYLQIVGDETERLEQIVGDLLDLAKLEGGAGALKQGQVQVPQLLERLRNRHERGLADGRIALETQCAPDVSTIAGDQNRLEQALQNLVANALRHTPAGGRISVAVSRTGSGTRIVVDDTGPGIPPEHLPHIFDRFYKVDTSRAGTETPSGSGLGLSIVQAIVRRHGGTITAGGAPGGGARFEIILPDVRTPVAGGRPGSTD